MRELRLKDLKSMRVGTPVIDVAYNRYGLFTGVEIKDGDFLHSTVDVYSFNSRFSAEARMLRLPERREDLPHLFIYNLSPDSSLFLQELAFKNGYFWPDVGKSAKATHEQCLIFYNYLIISSSSSDQAVACIHLDAFQPRCFYAAMFILSLPEPPPEIKALKPSSISQVLPPELIDLLKHSPDMPQLRGLIRSSTNKAVPLDVMASGTGAITEWLMDNIKIFPFSGSVSATMDPVRPRERTYPIPYELSEIERGSCSYSVTRYAAGTANVPERIVAMGEDVIREWIREQIDFDTAGDYEYDNHDPLESEPESEEINCDEALEDYRDNHQLEPAQ